MPKDPGVIFRQSEARRTRDVVEFVEATMLPPKGRDGSPDPVPPRIIKPAKLTASLSTGSLTAPTTADAEFYKFDTSNPPKLVVSGRTFTVTNYSTTLQGSDGDFCLVMRVGPVWMIVAKDC